MFDELYLRDVFIWLFVSFVVGGLIGVLTNRFARRIIIALCLAAPAGAFLWAEARSGFEAPAAAPAIVTLVALSTIWGLPALVSYRFLGRRLRRDVSHHDPVN
jgi:hypothetical protein